MNRGNTRIIVAIVAIIILGATGFYIFTNNSAEPAPTADSLPTTVYDTNDTPTTTNTKESDSTTSDDPETPTMANAYVAYSPTAFEEGSEKTRVLYFFANWCPTCIPVDKELQDNASEIPEGTVVYRVNYNDSETDQDEEAVAEQYGVTYQHTFVIVDSDGNEVNKWNGGGLDKLLSEL